MALFFSSINSGSNGNCYYVGNKNEAILVDAGVACRTIERRMKKLQLDLLKVKAIFVSHEHSDHIKGVPVLSEKYNIPVFITPRTLDHSGMMIHENRVRHFADGETVSIGDLQVCAFSKKHDACDPHSFVIRQNELQVGVFTDIGEPCNNLKKWFSGCHAAFLESNYDDEMLGNSQYPEFLKRRISGGNGHLSNLKALKVFCDHRSAFMTYLILSHLSNNNNTPELAAQIFSKHAGKVKVVVASRHEETPVFCVSEETITKPVRWVQSSLSFAS